MQKKLYSVTYILDNIKWDFMLKLHIYNFSRIPRFSFFFANSGVK